MNKKTFTSIFASFALCIGLQAAQVHSVVEDTSPAIRVFNGYTQSVSFLIYGGGASATNIANIGPVITAIDGSGNTDTIAEFAAVLAALTNENNQAYLTIDTDCSLGADSTDLELLNGTYTALPNRWLTIPWDTSAAGFYSIYLPDNVGPQKFAGNCVIQRVLGVPGGFGNVTTSIYLGGVLAAQDVVLDTGVAGSDTVNWEVNFPKAASLPVIIRSTLGTNATTGVISAVVE